MFDDRKTKNHHQGRKTLGSVFSYDNIVLLHPEFLVYQRDGILSALSLLSITQLNTDSRIFRVVKFGPPAITLMIFELSNHHLIIINFANLSVNNDAVVVTN